METCDKHRKAALVPGLSNHEKHVLMWDEIAERGCLKHETSTYKIYDPINACFACEEAGISHDFTDDPIDVHMWKMRLRCREYCPIDWSQFCDLDDNITPCESLGTPYSDWWGAEDTEDIKKLALVVRDLPWREK